MELKPLTIFGEALLNVGLPLLSVAASVSLKLIVGRQRHLSSSIRLPQEPEIDIERSREAGRRYLFYVWVQLILLLVKIAISAYSNYMGGPAFAIVSFLVELLTWGYAFLLCVSLVSSIFPKISREDLPVHLSFIYLAMLLLSGIRLWNEVKNVDVVNFSVNTILLVMVLVMPSVGHVSPESETGRPITREVYASILSLMTFSWIYPLLYLGYKRPLEYEDLWELSDSMRASETWQEFEQTKHAPLWKRIFLSNVGPISIQAFAAILAIFFNFASPYFLQRLLQYFENPSKESQKNAYFYVIAMFVAALLRVVMSSQAYYYGRRWCIRLTEALNGAIYAKALRRIDVTGTLLGNGENKSNADTGKLMSMMYIDTEEIAELVSYIFQFFQAPLEIAIGLVYLYHLLGISSVYGVGVMLVMILFNDRIGHNYGKVQGELKKARDKRISLNNEIVQGIRIIKYFAWEDKINERILESRNKELNQLLKVQIWSCGMNILWMATPLLVPIATFFSFTKLYGGTLDAATAFTSLAIFAMLREPLNAIPGYMVEIISASASLQRISAFLNEEEILEEEQDFSESHPIIGFENASFQWHSASVDTTGVALQDINLEFPRGQLSIICGPVGSGKTSLLLALLGEMKLVSGRRFLPRAIESVAFVSQQVWLQNASVRENITFGLPFDKSRYEEVLEICALNPDCELWHDRDLTEIGEKGITLSGGQKSRIALARAVYSKASCILLDDILSAVDSHTAQHLVKKCLSGNLMRNRTQIMATNHLRLLDMASYYVFMERGRVKGSGSMNDMIEGGFMENNIWIEQNNQIDKIMETSPITDNAAKNIQAPDGAPRKLVEKETSSTGGVSFNIYALYLAGNGGYLFWLVMLTSFILVRFLSVAESWWLKMWSDAYSKSADDELSTVPENLAISSYFTNASVAGVFRPWMFESNPVNVDYYILIYALIQFLTILLYIFGEIIQTLGSLRASRTLYRRLIDAVLHTPLRWSFVTPAGRIMSRFSKDIQAIDSNLARTTSSLLTISLTTMANAIVISSVTLPFLAVTVAILLIYLAFGALFVSSSRELKRLNSNSRSFVNTWFTETLSGVTTIRAFGAQHRFMHELLVRMDNYMRPFYFIQTANRWLYLQVGVVASTAILFVGVLLLMDDHTTAGLAGFTITFARNSSTTIYHLIREYTALEVGLNSVERVDEYINLPQEPKSGIHPPAAWPVNPSFELNNVSVRYSHDLENVLHNVTFSVRATEKIGIVGRTGSGKSTLGLTLFRFLDIVNGSITIDGLDISQINLHDLRSRLTMIPQDPILFSGTIRYNLDPFDMYRDADIWDALSRVALVNPTAIIHDQGSSLKIENSQGKNVVNSLEDLVSEGGSNFSQGQRQMLCLARAILKRAKIVIMDEATASIDFKTDEIIQTSLTTEFASSTVLCIAHRLKTVIRYDRIIVLDNGRVVEFDTPHRLIQTEGGVFRRLCEQSGEFELLDEMAAGV